MSATEAQAAAAIATLERAINAARNGNQAGEDAVVAMAAGLGLLATLQQIAGAHIPDQPESAPGDDLSWAQRHVGKLRGLAVAAVAKATGK